MVNVEDAQYAPFMNERNAECGLDIDAFAGEIIIASIRPTSNLDWTTQRGDASRNALTQGDSYLGPEFGFDAARDAHTQNFSGLVEQHETAPFGARYPDCDLEHPVEEFVGLDRKIDGFDDFMQGLQELGLSISGSDAVAPEQSRCERCDDLEG